MAKTQRAICLLGLLLFLTPVSLAASLKPVKGIAVVTIETARVHFEVEQVVVIEGDKALFLALDELGGELFRVDFDGKDLVMAVRGHSTRSVPLKKLLSLPLTTWEFLQIIQHELPAGFEKAFRKGHECWDKTGVKKFEVCFSEPFFVGPDHSVLPTVTMQNGKNRFGLRWMKRVN